MVLDGEDLHVAVPYGLHRAIVEIYLAYLKAALHRVRVQREPVILGGYMYTARVYILDGVVAPSVPEFQFVRFRSKGVPDVLMPQTNAHYGLLAEEAAYGVLQIRLVGGAGAGGEQDAVGLELEYIAGRCRRWDDCTCAAQLAQVAHDAELDPAVQHDDVVQRITSVGIIPFV